MTTPYTSSGDMVTGVPYLDQLPTTDRSTGTTVVDQGGDMTDVVVDDGEVYSGDLESGSNVDVWESTVGDDLEETAESVSPLSGSLGGVSTETLLLAGAGIVGLWVVTRR